MTTRAREADPLDRMTPPEPGTIRPYEFPDVVEGRLKNGLELRIVPKVPLPLVTAMAVLDAGETGVPGPRAGLAVLTSDALEGGTTSRSGRELAQALEGIGASFGTATGWDSTTVAVSCLAEHLPTALSLLAEMMRSPSFDQDEFDRYRAQRLATIRQRRMTPGTLASDAYAHHVYREGEAYGRPLGGTEDAVSVLTPEAARSFVGERYGPARAGLVVVGDVQVEEVWELAGTVLGDWTTATDPVPTPAPAARESKRRVHILHRPGAVQSEIRVGHVGAPRSTPDYFPLQIMNLALGGSFSSRLNLNLREKNGFTYGVRSQFRMRRGPGPFFVSTAVESAVNGAALEEIVHEIEAMADRGPTEEEVRTATSYLAGVFPLRMETTGQLASRIAELLVHGLPGDYYRTYRDHVRGVTRQEASEAAGRHLRPAELCTVVVGDADAVAGDLETLGIGPVQVHHEDGEGGDG